MDTLTRLKVLIFLVPLSWDSKSLKASISYSNLKVYFSSFVQVLKGVLNVAIIMDFI